MCGVRFAETFSHRPLLRAVRHDEAVAYVKKLSAEGKSRQEIAAAVTTIVDNRVYNVNSWERITKYPNYIPFASYFNDDEDNFDAFKAKSNSFDNDAAAQYAWESQYGQCEECACLSYYLLKQAGVDGNVRIFSSAEGSRGGRRVLHAQRAGGGRAGVVSGPAIDRTRHAARSDRPQRSTPR